MTFGKKLIYILTVKNISETELAAMINQKKQNVSRWCSGKFKPSIKNINKIAKALNISVEDLLDDNKNFSDVQININSKGTVNQSIQKEKENLKDKEIALLKKEIELLKKELNLKNKKNER